MKKFLTLGLVAALAAGTVIVTGAQADWDGPGGRGGRGGDHGFMMGGNHGLSGGPGHLMRVMRQVDADGDGRVTQAEIDAFVTAETAAADANTDGNLSLDEFQTVWLKFMRPQMVDRFQSLDDDGDGQVTRAELDERFGGIVGFLDRNGDEALSRDDRPRFGRGGRDRDEPRRGEPAPAPQPQGEPQPQ